MNESTVDVSGSRILVVDDLPDNVDVLRQALEVAEYQVMVAPSGELALNLAERFTPDLILLDVVMPGLDGFETCLRLKQAESTRDIPIIFLTARTESADIVKGFELGAADYVTKPFNKAELLARVQTHLTLKEQRDTILRQHVEQKELLHILCHDLTNPLGSIRGLMELVLEEPDELAECGPRIIKGADIGLDIIRLVRQMRALEEGKVALARVDLHQAVRTAADMLHTRLEAKELRLDIQVDAEIQVSAESTSLVNCVISNLLTNAIKFSYPGSAIGLQAERVDDRVTVSLRDRGMGMPPALVKDLFDMSKATSRPGTGGEQGTGFGMPLVAKFVESYGGRIEVFSTDEKVDPQGHGTEVKLTFRSG